MDTTKIYDEIADRGIITEREVNLIKGRLNKYCDAIIKRRIFANGPLKLTPEQTEKGIKWLLDKYKTPRGVVRKNNPFNKKQAAILENFKEFELVNFWDSGTFFVCWWLPVYLVRSKHGREFLYIPTWGNKKSPVEIIENGTYRLAR